MEFKFSDIEDYYRIDATVYRVDLYKKPITEDEFTNQIASMIRYHCKKHGISWLAVYSCTDSKTAQQSALRTGKRGRPQKCVTGDKVDAHVHIVLKGTPSHSAYSTAMEIKKSFDKKYSKKGEKVSSVVSLGRTAHAYYFVHYCYRQGGIVRTGGDFDFFQYVIERDMFNQRDLFG